MIDYHYILNIKYFFNSRLFPKSIFEGWTASNLAQPEEHKILHLRIVFQIVETFLYNIFSLLTILENCLWQGS